MSKGSGLTGTTSCMSSNEFSDGKFVDSPKALAGGRCFSVKNLLCILGSDGSVTGEIAGTFFGTF